MSRFTAVMQQRLNGSQERVNQIVSIFDSGHMRLVLLAASVFMALLYLWLVNSSATAGFQLSDLEKELVTLEQEYKKLEVEYAGLHSLEHVQKAGEEMGLVAATQVEYVGVTGVASAR